MTLKVWLSDQISKWSETPSPLDREFSPTTVCGLRWAIGVTLQSQQRQFSFNSELEDKDTQLTTSAGQRSSRRPIGPIVLVSPITPTSTLTNRSNHASCQTSAHWDEKLEMRHRVATSWQCTWWLSQIRAMASFTWAETRANVHFNFRDENLDAIPASPEILFQNIELKTSPAFGVNLSWRIRYDSCLSESWVCCVCARWLMWDLNWQLCRTRLQPRAICTVVSQIGILSKLRICAHITMSMESKIQIFALESYSAFHKFSFSMILTLSLCRSGFEWSDLCLRN